MSQQDREYELKRGSDKSGGLPYPVHSRDSIEAAEARVFGRRRRWKLKRSVIRRPR